MLELLATNRWITGRLTDDATLAEFIGAKVYRELAPPGTPLPYCIFALQDAGDRNGVGGARIFSRPIYLVKAVCEGADEEPLRDIVTRIDVLLQGTQNADVDGFRIQGAVRLSSVGYLEKNGDKQFCHLGGLYRIFLGR